MEPAQHNNELTVETGRRGGQKRMAQLSDQGRSDLGKLAARARWHPDEFQAEKDKARRLADLIQQALKDGK